MGNEYIILEGKDYDKLIAQGMQHFNSSKENLQVEVLESKKNTFFLLTTRSRFQEPTAKPWR